MTTRSQRLYPPEFVLSAIFPNACTELSSSCQKKAREISALLEVHILAYSLVLLINDDRCRRAGNRVTRN